MNTKNIFKTVALAMMMPAMLLTTACSNEDDAINNGDNKKGYPLQVTVNVTRQGDKATTRATYTDNGNGTGSLAFSAGDQLLVRGNDKSDGGAGRFAGMLDYVSEGTFSGTIYTENSYSGTADALFTAANSTNWVGAALFPNGYETYAFLSLSGSGYSTSYSMSYNQAIAATKAAAIEQFSLETAKTYSGSFALSPENAIFNFTITGLTDGAKAVTLKDKTRTMFTGSVTPTSGTAAFALGAKIQDNNDFTVNLKNVTLTIGGTDIAITSTNNNLAAGKIYNVTRSALTYPIALSAVTSGYLGSVVTSDGYVYAKAADATAASKTAVAKITYVGSDTGVDGKSHGLALSLSDVSTANYNWATAISACASKTPAVTNASSWMLPSQAQWNKMITAAGSYTALRDGFSGVGGTNLNSGTYWSSTDHTTEGNAWAYKFNQGKWGGFTKNASTVKYTRACIAF